MGSNIFFASLQSIFIKKNDSAAQGVEILIGINELDNWVLKKMSL